MTRVLLINPSWGGRFQGGRFNRPWPPLDLLNVAAELKAAGFHVTLCDARASGLPPDAAVLPGADPDIVVLTSSPLDRWQCPNVDLAPFFSWVRRLKQLFPASPLIITGAHGTVFPEHILKATGARVVVRGEPEGTVRDLCLEAVYVGECPHTFTLAGGNEDGYRGLSVPRGGTDPLPPSRQGRGNSCPDVRDRGGPALSRIPSLSFCQGGVIHHTLDSSPADLGAFSLPAYDLTRPELYTYEPLGDRLAVLETSRGCSHRCLFCFKAIYGQGIRCKSLNQVQREIETIVRHGYRSLYFMDLNLAWNRSRTMDLCRLLRAFSLRWCCQSRVDSVDEDLLKEMAAAGCRLVHYGIEGGSPAAWERMGKGIGLEGIERAVGWTKKAGMATAGFFLGGFPWETADDRHRTELLARRLAMTYSSFHVVTCYAGTPMARLMGVKRPWWEEPPAASLLQDWVRRATWRTLLSPRSALEALRRGVLRPEVLRLLWTFLKDMSSPEITRPLP